MLIMEKRVVLTKNKKGLTVSDLLLIGVLLAAGAVLKFFVGSVINFGMKPNFIIAMYCLIILLIKPRLREAAIIGLLAGAICQFFLGHPYINFASELLGAIAMSLLILMPMNIVKFLLNQFCYIFFYPCQRFFVCWNYVFDVLHRCRDQTYSAGNLSGNHIWNGSHQCNHCPGALYSVEACP
jgi:hypothetical protein